MAELVERKRLIGRMMYRCRACGVSSTSKKAVTHDAFECVRMAYLNVEGIVLSHLYEGHKGMDELLTRSKKICPCGTAIIKEVGRYARRRRHAR